MRLRLPGRKDKHLLSPAGSDTCSPPPTPGLSFSSSSDLGLSSGERSPGPRAPSYSSCFPGGTGGVNEGTAFGSFAEQDKLKVVIVGTGFAGLSAAIACARQGFSVTVLERTSGLSQHGDSIMFGCNASKVLHRWGVGDEMYQRAGSKGGRWLFTDCEGVKVHEEDLSGFSQQYGAPLLQGRRATFLGSLGTEARLLGVTIRLEAEVVQYVDSRYEPAVVLRNGGSLPGDVILVADGVHSLARELLAPHDRPAERQQLSGYSIHRAVASGTALREDKRCRHLLDGLIRTWLGEDSHCCLYIWTMVTFTHRDISTSASLNWRDKRSMTDVLELLGDGWDPVLLAALKHFPSALHWPVLKETPAEEWISTGRKICFIGDSVHAMQAYEAIRRPTVAEAQKLGNKQQDIWHHLASSRSSPLPTGSLVPPPTDLITQKHPLSPLSFSLYSHDAELFAIQNFRTFAQAVDPSFQVRREWILDAAKRAEIPVKVSPHGSAKEVAFGAERRKATEDRKEDKQKDKTRDIDTFSPWL
ncbi:hypothetical protein JCM11641_001643 [Rhodosporidiobolus odoratus]